MILLHAATEHVGPFRNIIDTISGLLQEVNMEFYGSEDTQNSDTDSDNQVATETGKKSKSGMRILSVDSSRTVLIFVRLDANNFKQYICKKQKIDLGINLVNFFKLIRTIEKDDEILILYLDSEDINRLGIIIKNQEKNVETRYKINLLDLDEEKIKIPASTFEALVTIPSQMFHKMCREMSGYADHLEIRCINKDIHFICKGEIGERETIVYGTQENGQVTIKHNSSSPNIIQGIYELKNLTPFSKLVSICNDIEIYLRNKYPLAIRYTVATLGKITLCVTPLNIKKNVNVEDSDSSSDSD